MGLDEIRKFIGRCERQVSGIEKRYAWADAVFVKTWRPNRQYESVRSTSIEDVPTENFDFWLTG